MTDLRHPVNYAMEFVMLNMRSQSCIPAIEFSTLYEGCLLTKVPPCTGVSSRNR